MPIGLPAILGPDLLYMLRALGYGDEIALVEGIGGSAEAGVAWRPASAWNRCAVRQCHPAQSVIDPT